MLTGCHVERFILRTSVPMVSDLEALADEMAERDATVVSCARASSSTYRKPHAHDGCGAVHLPSHASAPSRIRSEPPSEDHISFVNRRAGARVARQI